METTIINRSNLQRLYNGARTHLTIQLLAHSALGIHGEALVEPEVAPVCVGHQVTKPAMADLVHNDVSK